MLATPVAGTRSARFDAHRPQGHVHVAGEHAPDLAALHPPTWFRDQMVAAIAEGHALGTRIAAELGAGSDGFDPALVERALGSIGPAPDAATTARELELLHATAATRTPAGIEAAVWLAAHGTRLLWEEPRAQVRARLGADDAHDAIHLIDHSMRTIRDANDIGKERFGRARPFDTDPTLSTAVLEPTGNPSYPSGHTSAAVVEATLLGTFLPERARELQDSAIRTAWSRVYGGVHFPSDTIAGARIGAAVATATGLDHLIPVTLPVS